MSNFSKNQKMVQGQRELGQLELSLRDKQFKMSMRDKCIQYAIQTAQPNKSGIATAENPEGKLTPPTTNDIIRNAELFFQFVNKDAASSQASDPKDPSGTGVQSNFGGK